MKDDEVECVLVLLVVPVGLKSNVSPYKCVDG